MKNEDLKSANSVKIGIVFSDTRSSMGLTPLEVSKTTLINLKYIMAIESGDYSGFPSEGFARAYFIKYAKFLSIKNDFPPIYESSTRKNEIVEKSVPTLNKSAYKIFVISISILIALTFTLINIFSNKNLKPVDVKYGEINPSKENISLIVKSVENNIISSQDKSPEKIESMVAEISNEIKLFFNAQCWIEIYSNDELVEYQLFNSGDRFSRIINKPFKIIIGNAEAVSGTYNGNVIDFISNANRLRVNTIIFNDE